MNKCQNYRKTWRYEFNHSKSGVVTFGESKPLHCKSMKEREWALGDDTVEKLYEYKNLGVLKNYCGSFASNISDNIDKTRKKAGMVFSSSVDRRKTNSLIYVKFWRQACLPSLLFGAELFNLRLLPVCCLSLNTVSPCFLKNFFMCQILKCLTCANIFFRCLSPFLMGLVCLLHRAKLFIRNEPDNHTT